VPRALLQGCSDERYAEEAAAVESFLATRGESRLVTLRAQRDQASAELAFESAAALHAQVQRVEAVHALAAELVRPLSHLRAVILQASANPDEVAVFLLRTGACAAPSRSRPLYENSERTIGIDLALRAANGDRTRAGSAEIREQRSEIEQSPEEQEVKGHDFSRADSSQSNERALAPVETVAPAQETTIAHPAKLLAAFSSPASKPRWLSFPRQPSRPQPPSAKATWRCSSAGTTARGSPHGRSLLPRR